MKRRLLAVAALSVLALTACGSASERSTAYVERAREYLAEGDEVKARLDLRNAVKIEPDNVEARMLLVQIAERERNFKAMVGQLRRVLTIDPDHVEAHVKLGVILLGAAGQNESERAQLLDEVRGHVDAALAVAPDHPDARVLEATLMSRDGDRAAAFEKVREVLAEHPGNVAGVSLLFSLYLPDDPEAALVALDEGIEANPEASSLHLLKVGLLQSLERWEAVEAALLDFRDRFPDQQGVDYRLLAFYTDRGRLDDAEAVLEQMLERYPDDTSVKLEYAEFLANHRDTASSEATLERFAAQNPEVQEFRFALATLYESDDRNADAAAQYERIIAATGEGDDAIRARNRLARLRVREGDLDAARSLIDAVLEEAPSEPEALTMRAALLLEQGELDAAIADLRTVYRNDPQSEGALRLLAQAHLRAGDDSLAEERLRDLLENHPDDAFARDELAKLLVARGEFAQAERVLTESEAQQTLTSLRLLIDVLTRQEQYEQARSAAAQLVAQEPTRALGHFLTGRIYQAEQRYEESLESFQQALDVAGPNAELLSAMTASYTRAGRPDDAIPALEAWREEAPENYEVHLLLGQVHARARRWEEAEGALEQALNLEEDAWSAYRDLAGVRLATGDPGGAVEVLERGLAAIPDSLQLNLLLAQLYESGGRFDEAIARYERILEIDPDSALAANNLAALIADHQIAPERLQYALELTERLRGSDNPLYLDTVGWVNYRAGNLDEAIALLERAVRSASGAESLQNALPQLRYHLGMAYFQAEETDQARRELQAAVDTASDRGFPGLEEARDTLARL